MLIKRSDTDLLEWSDLYSYPCQIDSLWQHMNIHKEINSSALNVSCRKTYKSSLYHRSVEHHDHTI